MLSRLVAARHFGMAARARSRLVSLSGAPLRLAHSTRGEEEEAASPAAPPRTESELVSLLRSQRPLRRTEVRLRSTPKRVGWVLPQFLRRSESPPPVHARDAVRHPKGGKCCVPLSCHSGRRLLAGATSVLQQHEVLAAVRELRENGQLRTQRHYTIAISALGTVRESGAAAAMLDEVRARRRGDSSPPRLALGALRQSESSSQSEEQHHHHTAVSQTKNASSSHLPSLLRAGTTMLDERRASERRDASDAMEFSSPSTHL